MRKLNVCVDIDGTLTDPFYWVDKSNEYFNTNLKHEEINQYEIHSLLGITRDEFWKFYTQYGEYLHSNAEIRENAKETVHKLNELTNIFYVTARQKKMKNVTEEWLKKYDLPQKEMFLLGSHDKVNKANELNCDIFIEDRYKNAIELASQGIKVILIDCSYNRKPLIDGITRVYNWNEIYDIVLDYHNELNNEVSIASA